MLRPAIVDGAPGDPLDTFETLVLGIEVSNRGDHDVIIDHHRSKLFLEVRSPSGDRLFVLDEEARQRMTRPRSSRELPPAQTIAAGSSARFEFDLAQYHYPLAAGAYRIAPCCEHAGERSEGDAIAVRVVPSASAAVRPWYENPIFGSDVLVAAIERSDGRRAVYLRWFCVNQPLAAFLNRPLETPAGAKQGVAPIAAVAAFFDLDDLETGYQRVLVWPDADGRLAISRNLLGEAKGVAIHAELPTRDPLLPFSFRDPDGNVFVFTGASSVLRAFRIDPSGGVEDLFEHRVEGKIVPEYPIAVGGGPDIVHVVRAGRALSHTMLNFQGDVVQETIIAESRAGRPRYLAIDLAADRIWSAYDLDETMQDGSVELIESNFPSLEVPAVRPRVSVIRLPRGRSRGLREIDFRFDRAGRPHVVYATDGGRLLYAGTGGRVRRLARGEAAYFPCLLPSGDREILTPFVGFYRAPIGYRFYPTAGSDPWAAMRRPVA